ncbi:hypothetical protein ZEAMMB73_Zm00001d037562 [Zea mays]|uniref:Uncharacterized protein n=1 Tax=Zea mays TaxID=4577 RepID=A0A1D6LZ47_MAIZE|nr:hypothetical protein ZEAMMB73_Zm00001d037562 [Zea mays]
MGDEENIGKIGGAIGIENGNTGEARKWCGVVTSSYGRIAGHHRLRETHLLGRFILHACFRQVPILFDLHFSPLPLQHHSVLYALKSFSILLRIFFEHFAEGSKDVGASRIIGIDIDNKKIDVAASKVPTVAAWTTSSRVMLFPATTASKCYMMASSAGQIFINLGFHFYGV